MITVTEILLLVRFEATTKPDPECPAEDPQQRSIDGPHGHDAVIDPAIAKRHVLLA